MALILGLALTLSMAGCGKAAAATTVNSNGTKEVSTTEGAGSDEYFTWDGDTITGLTDSGEKQTNLVIPDSAKTIGDSAFVGNLVLTSVTLGGVEEIGNGAFFLCKNLTEMSFPDSLKKIADSAFHGCESLKTITFSVGLEVIGEDAFALCSSLEKIELPEGLTSLGDTAFSPCSNLNELYLPASLENIPARAFWIMDGANVYVKEGSWADIHYSEFVDKNAISEDLIYIKNYY